MSSDDEFAKYDPTTPRPAKKAGTRAATTRAASSNKPPIAGPSRAAAPKRNTRQRQESVEVEVEETSADRDVVVLVDTDEDSTTRSKTTAAKSKARTTQARVGTGRANGKPPPRSKGKSKADPQPIVHVDTSEEPMDVDDVQVIDKLPPLRATHGTRTAKSSKTSADPARRQNDDDDDSLRTEIDRLQRQVAEVISQRDKLAQQMEELFRLRHTEPEEALLQQAAQYEARLQTQDLLIQEQAKLIKASASGQPYMLHFLSREAADEEKKDLEKEIAHWKEIVNQRDKQLAEKDKTIASLQEEKDLLQADLKAEIERSKTLGSRNPPPSVTRATAIKRGTDEVDPKNVAVFHLYEDMTNILVMSVKVAKTLYPDIEEKHYDCVFTVPAEHTYPILSLHFYLRKIWDRIEDADPNAPIKEQLQAKIQYQPVDLDKERPELIERLEFFKDPFVFAYDQLHVFLKTLTDRLVPTQDTSEEEDELANDTEA